MLDEPTASLPRAEVVRLMGALTRFADAGQTILFVSHRLDEVIDSCDKATVLRDGRLAGTLEGDEITETALIELIAGRELERRVPVDARPPASEEVALEAKDVTGGPLRGVSFQLHRGEVLGVAGLLGSGRSELLKMAFGAYPIQVRVVRARRQARRASATSARPWTPASPTSPRTAAPRRRSPT